MTVRDYGLMYAEYLKGKSLNELGKSINQTAGAIRYHFLKRGFTLRTQSESMKNMHINHPDAVEKMSKTMFKKGHNTWIKGLTKENDVRVKKLSERNECVFDADGYKRVWHNGRRVLEHHLRWCSYYRWYCIPSGYVIHHINGIKTDNSIENLIILSRAEHALLHYGWQLKEDKNRILWGVNYGCV